MSEALKDSLIGYLDKLDRTDLPPDQKSLKYLRFFQYMVQHITDSDVIQFSTTFARLHYIIEQYRIRGEEVFHLFTAQKWLANGVEPKDEHLDLLCLAKEAINVLLIRVFGLSSRYTLDKTSLEKMLSLRRNIHVGHFIKEVKVFITNINIEDGSMVARTMGQNYETIRIEFSREDRNVDYNDIISILHKNELIPIACNLLDVEVDRNGIFYPSSFVLEPDRLFDVTAIAECFGPFGTHELGYIVRKFVHRPTAIPILIGNLANYFLDRLIFDRSIQYQDFEKRIFHLFPLEFCLMKDDELREVLIQLEHHFKNIKSAVTNQLTELKINGQNSYIEPSFYSTKYGIQGRLDLLAQTGKTISIVELKSGRPFRPNSFGISNNHYHQTLVYDMLVESVFKGQFGQSNYILYSKENEQPVRYAPSIKVEQREALKVRNRLLLHDLIIQHSGKFIDYFRHLVFAHRDKLKGYVLNDINLLLRTFESLSPIEVVYCNTLLSFVMHEYAISKLGNDEGEHSSGLASLWRDSLEIKSELFSIINDLTIGSNECQSDEPMIVLSKTQNTAQLNNFRTGDIGVLYPKTSDNFSALRNQVFKCTVISQDMQKVKVRLRNRQENDATFKKHKHWHLEHDHLDGGYNLMTRSVFEFASAKARFRSLILCQESPEEYEMVTIPRPTELTDEQYEVFRKIVSSKDYFLLWGPPGTGKTSIMIKNLCKYYHEETPIRILAVAYTNRAVDEICDAVQSIEPEIKYTRVGSRYSTREDLRTKLLDAQIQKLSNRSSLRHFLEDTRIYVGTLSSVAGKPAIFDLLTFDVVIVDEASQILEPSLIGLLSRVKKFILIGDHLQLPAVVQQRSNKSQVKDPLLANLGFTNFSNSLFERVYKSAVSKGWNHAVGLLSFQGRMHTEIMNFVNTHYYDQKLKALPGLKRLLIKSPIYSRERPDEEILKHRIIYIPTEIDLNSKSIKVNEGEARVVLQIVNKYLCLNHPYGTTDNRLLSLGVITPFKAQIAKIFECFDKSDHGLRERVTVDTVERYQGSARDVIILSASVNTTYQLRSIVSLSDQRLDRKLNVALTRAREQFILIGNREILSQNIIYRHLIETAEKVDPESLNV